MDGNFNRNIKTDPNFRCKHMMSVLNCLPDEGYDKAQFLEKRKPKLDERFIITIDERDFVTYPGSLDLGHLKGILKIEVEPVQIPTKENGHFAVCKAIVISKNGESFVDVGDANPVNCSSRVSKHLLRMASTRAIARALRSFTNIGMTCLEELADLDDVIGKGPAKPMAKTTKTPSKKAPEPPKAKEQTARKEEPKTEMKEKPGKKEEIKKPAGNTVLPKMSEAQKRAVYNLSRRRGITVDCLVRQAPGR